MKILFVGECSYLHNTLKRGLEELGHKVLIVSDGNGWHNSPRDIDLRRPERWGKLGGLWVLWSLLKSLPQLCGNDIVQLRLLRGRIRGQRDSQQDRHIHDNTHT